MPLTPEQVQTAAPILAASIFAFAIVLLLLSLRLFRKSRRDACCLRRINSHGHQRAIQNRANRYGHVRAYGDAPGRGAPCRFAPGAPTRSLTPWTACQRITPQPSAPIRPLTNASGRSVPASRRVSDDMAKRDRTDRLIRVLAFQFHRGREPNRDFLDPPVPALRMCVIMQER